MKTIEKQAEDLVLSYKYICSTWEEDADVKCAIKSVEHTIEVLEKVLAHDKERYGIVSRGATIEKDQQTELLTELKSRL